MNPLIILLTELVYRPIFNLLVIFLTVFKWNMWLAIIALTLSIRLLMFKSSVAQNDMQKQMTDLQPKLHEIQEKYKDDPTKMSEETMKILKTHWWWPLKWCLMMLIQLPIFIWLFYVIKNFSAAIDPSKINLLINDNIYSFFSFITKWYLNVSHLNSYFLGIDLYVWKNILLSILAWLLIYFQMKLTMLNKPATPTQTPAMPWMPAMPDMSKMMWFMNIFMVFMMFSFVYSINAWVWIYIITTTLFSIVQYMIQYKELIKVKLIVLFSKKK